jgi:hypothetical protein
MRHFKSTLLILSASLLASCQMYTPGGNPFTNGPDSAATYLSTEEFPKTVTLLDTRTGKKLVIDFVTDLGDNPVLTPDLMSWELFPSDVGYGPLSNSMTVPNRWSRRIDVTMRDSSEYANPITDRPLRVDEVNDQPDWWSTDGGPNKVFDPSNGYDP